jgi:3-hydroxyisobutyrate dehydrogenase-like beta-hydroxyacid dehydrogenase
MASGESIQNIGVIGLGRMGAAIASNILKSGFNVIVYNRTADKIRPLVEVGALKATSPKVAMKSDVVVTSLRDDHAVLDVVSGEEEILSGYNNNNNNYSQTEFMSGRQIFCLLFQRA